MTNLNPSTEEIEKIYPGPALVLAGPGTGKTHLLAKRIKYFIEEKKQAPESITVITFTTEAAKNMRDRLSDVEKPDVFVPPDQQPPSICTMHSLGYQIIREHFSKVDLMEDFELLSSDDIRKLLVQDAAQVCGVDRSIGLQAGEYKQKATVEQAGEAEVKVLTKYEQILKACNFIDYDDQIMLACKILRENPDVLEVYRAKTKHLLVDEYQDINTSQFELIKLLSQNQEDGLFVVGDDDQSIYSFRGGTPEHIRRFSENYPGTAKVKSLDLYRRSPKNFLKAGLRVVEKFDAKRVTKPEEHFKNPLDAKVVFYDVPSQDKESEMVAGIAKKSLPLHDVLVLVPNGGFTEPIKRALRRKRIHYFCKTDIYRTGLSLFDVVRKWIEDEKDSFALRQIIEQVIDGGTTGIPSARSRTDEKKEQRKSALAKISNLWEEVIRQKKDLHAVIKEKAGGDETIQSISAALDEIIKAKNSEPVKFIECISRLFKPWASVQSFQDEIRKWLEEAWSQNQGGTQGVKILTMQAAKGLEADVVCVVGFDKEIIPNNKGNDGHQEQARLFYVSMTRAKRELYLFHSRKRDAKITHLSPPKGQAYLNLEPSPFLSAISADFLEKKYVQSEAVKNSRKQPKKAVITVV